MQRVDITKPTELGFVTATDPESKTFFLQLCKFSNPELQQFNAEVNEYCKQAIEKQVTSQEPKPDELRCAKYSVDGSWYRSSVLSVSEDKKTCKVAFVDYGNLETVRVEDTLPLDFDAQPKLKRQPFGITCFYTQIGKLNSRRTAHLFEALQSNYLLLKIVARPTDSFCEVDIPMHAYNVPFWHLFQPELRERSKHRVQQDQAEQPVESASSS